MCSRNWVFCDLVLSKISLLLSGNFHLITHSRFYLSIWYRFGCLLALWFSAFILKIDLCTKENGMLFDFCQLKCSKNNMKLKWHSTFCVVGSAKNFKILVILYWFGCKVIKTRNSEAELQRFVYIGQTTDKIKAILRDLTRDEKSYFHFFHHIIMKWPWLSPYITLTVLILVDLHKIEIFWIQLLYTWYNSMVWSLPGSW